jgi:serine phosphatase RsbU (regulator of sigma subunit)
MKIRTQLVLVCFLLSVVPLTAIAVYSYDSSRRALEAAYHGEARRMTAQMDRRLAVIRNDLQQRLAEVSALPALSDSTSSPADVRNILATMGDTASLVDSIEIRQMHPVPKIAEAKHPAPAPHPTAPKAPATAPEPGVKIAVDVSNVAKGLAGQIVKQVTGEAVADAVPDTPRGPIVIEIPVPPKRPHFTITDEQRTQLDQIRTLGQELGRRSNDMDDEERKAMEKQLASVQEAFNKSIQESQAQLQDRFKAAFDARELARKQRLLAARHVNAQRSGDAAAAGSHPSPPAAPVAAVPPVASAPPVAATSQSAKSDEDAGEPDSPEPATSEGAQSMDSGHRVTDADRMRLAEREKMTSLVFGQKFDAPLREKGEVVGQVQAHVSTDEVLRRVLGAESEDRSEIAFAVDRAGNLYTRNPEDRTTLEGIGVKDRLTSKQSLTDIPNWIVVLNPDLQSGLRIGVARPVGETFGELRKTAAKNFGYGMGLVFLALIGMVPIANHMTRDVEAVTRGAERVAQGDLMTRVPVTSNRSEIGQLATAFNRMAEDLSLQQQRIVTQERERQEQSMQNRLLEAEYTRKSEDLEEARRFQLSLLPKHVPANDDFDIAVFTRTAAEVGGDYYDFHTAGNGVLSTAVGDATGHGARAGTMVTVIKALFAGYSSETSPAKFLIEAAEKVKRMDLPRMAMALMVARLERHGVTIASAGMPPAYVHRAATGAVDEIALHATPLGTLGADYHDELVPLAVGDTMLLMTDGFPELLDASGQQLGYTAAMQEFAAAATAPDAGAVIAALEESARRWHGAAPPNDDVTFVVVRKRA